MNKKLISMIIGLSLTASLIGCSNGNNGIGSAEATKSSKVTSTNAKLLSSIDISSGESETAGEASTFIELGNNITVKGSGAKVDKNVVTITSAGTYSISGTSKDCQIKVNAGDEDKVYIILNGVSITSSNNAPVYAMNSKKTVISLADNTKNFITDGENYVSEDKSNEEPNAAIYSKSDLTFIGNGTLTVEGRYKNGIESKDDLKIQSGNITINSKEDGILGKDSVVITNGNIKINSGFDGIKSNNAEDADKGYVLIEGGKINITSGKDGIQGEINALVKNGDITITSGGGSKNAPVKTGERMDPGMRKEPTAGGPDATSNTKSNNEESTGSKAIKAGVNVVVEGGTFNIDSYDDALHSNNNLVINNGAFNISSGDDAVHAESTLTVNKGTINIKKSYEGVESETISINDGNINLISSDDGFNAGGVININGGYIVVNANGDGIDSNGSVSMKAGTVIVSGPTSNGNGALDYNESFDLSGGFLIAAGSSGMAEAPSTSSTQNSIKINLTTQSAGSIIRVENEAGEEIITFAPSKEYSSVVLSSPKLKNGSTYKVYLGGSSRGTATDGVYSNSSYTKGKEIGSIKISSSVSELTEEGATVSKMGGGKGGRMPGGQRPNDGAGIPQK